MKWLEKEIRERGKVVNDDILKVNSFLNHQLDPKLLDKMCLLWYDHFNKNDVTKILTIEASGIALATLASLRFNTKVVYAKKGESSTLGEHYCATIHSFTKGNDTNICVEKTYLTSNDRVLILDDFLATGSAIRGLIDICKQAGATIVGIGTAIEKGYQHGGDSLREEGYDVYSLEIIEHLDKDTNSITFR
ncbi:MAG: xanthine phosphoribosyltransferase [Acholeplasmatales bacterium]|nr:xanthine phosphoribosyltransferase [Acholeplasmatales bacterium]